VLYVRPLYTASRSNPQPQLTAVIAAYNGTVVYEPTLQTAVDAVFGSNAPQLNGATSPQVPTTPVTPGAPSSKAQQDVAAALAAYAKAQAALKNGDFATYGSQMQIVHQQLQAAQNALAAAPVATPTTTTTTTPKASTTTTTNNGQAAGSGTPSAKTASSRRTPSTTTTTKPGET
jgi:hypothetical protein